MVLQTQSIKKFHTYLKPANTHPLRQSIISLLARRKCVPHLRYHIHRRDPIVVRKVVPFGHRIVRENLKLLRVLIRGLE